jgi:hypothetical protein
MQNPNKINNHKVISEETVKKVLAQRRLETGEAEPVAPKQRMISLQMSEDFVRQCEAMAEKMQLTRSGFIKMVLSEYLRTNADKL